MSKRMVKIFVFTYTLILFSVSSFAAMTELEFAPKKTKKPPATENKVEPPVDPLTDPNNQVVLPSDVLMPDQVWPQGPPADQKQKPVAPKKKIRERVTGEGENPVVPGEPHTEINKSPDPFTFPSDAPPAVDHSEQEAPDPAPAKDPVQPAATAEVGTDQTGAPEDGAEAADPADPAADGTADGEAEQGTTTDSPPAEEDPVVAPPITKDIKDYYENGEKPKYIKINIDGYNIRSTSAFSKSDKNNIAYKSSDGSVLAVAKLKKVPGRDAVSVKVCIGGSVKGDTCVSPGKDHYVLVPYGHGADFQFCDSQDCFGQNLSDVIDQVSNGFPATTNNGAACDPENNGVGPNTEGVDSEPAGGKPNPEVPSAGRFPFKVKPLWEKDKPKGAGSAVGTKWSKMLLESINKYGKGLVGASKFSDQKYWCPNWNKLDPAEKTEFWVHMFNGIARYESNWDVKATFDEENKRGVRSGPVNPKTYSQGLFQLSYTSAAQSSYNNYCKFSWRADKRKGVSDPSLTIYDPKKQMDCAVGMMNYLVGQNRTIGLDKHKGGARFWSTLRSTNPATKKVREVVKKFTPCWE